MRKKDIDLSNRYELVTNDSDDFYSFTTDFDGLYHLSFKDSTYVLTIHQGLFGFFEFSFEPVIDASDSDKKRLPFDEKVRNTIAYALIRFFEDTENILYYVCDSSDGRQLSRERLFKKWFADMQPFPVSQLEVSLSDDLKILILIHDAFPFVEQFKEELSGSEMFYSAQK